MTILRENQCHECFFRFKKAREGLKGMQVLGRVGELDEICRTFAFVISDENSFMTGSNVVCDGGYILANQVGHDAAN